MKKTIALFFTLLSIFIFVALNRNAFLQVIYKFNANRNIDSSYDLSILNPSEEIYEADESILKSRNYQYYYNCLSEDDQIIYRQLYFIYQNKLSNATISTTDVDKANKIHQLILLDNPELFYISNSKYTKTSDSEGNVLQLEYSANPTESDEEITRIQAEIDNYIKDFSCHITSNMSDYNKAVAAYTYIIQNTEYVKDAPHNQDIYSAVLGQTVCQGYSLMFKHLCDHMHIPCIMVTGSTKTEPHSWNMVCLDGIWCSVDATFGDSNYLNKPISYSWFGISNQTMKETRIIDYKEYLPTDEEATNDYYLKHGLCFDNYDLDTLKKLSSNSDFVSFKYSNADAYKKAVDRLFYYNDYQQLPISLSTDAITYVTDNDSKTIYISK